MPTRLKRPCNYPGCPALIQAGTRYCEKHKKQEAKRYDEQRGTAAQRGYSGRWQRYRKTFLARHPLCRHCEEKGTVKAAELVHHKKPIAEGGSVFDFNNMESLCDDCHRKHHGYGGKGLKT